MVENLESLASRFLATVGVVEPAGYRTIEVLLDERAQPYFGGRERLLLAFSPEAFHEHPDAELITYGSSFLDTMAEVATLRGNAIHLYLNGLQSYHRPDAGKSAGTSQDTRSSGGSGRRATTALSSCPVPF